MNLIPTQADFAATARQIEQDRAAALAPFYAAKAKRAETRLIEAKAKTAGLNDGQRVRLAIYLIDGVDRIGSDLRVEAECVLADVLSGVRHD